MAYIKQMIIASGLLCIVLCPFAAAAAAASESEGESQQRGEDDDNDDHRGFYSRFIFALGYSQLSSGNSLNPIPGIRKVENPSHRAPAFNLSLDLGGGIKGFAVHAGVWFERMITRDRSPTTMGMTLFGIGGGLTYYVLDWDVFVTANVRLTGLLMFLPDAVCDDYSEDKYEWYKGPGVSFTVGKEWFDGDNRGMGLGIQLNYSRLTKDISIIDYLSLMLALTVSRF